MGFAFAHVAFDAMGRGVTETSNVPPDSATPLDTVKTTLCGDGRVLGKNRCDGGPFSAVHVVDAQSGKTARAGVHASASALGTAARSTTVPGGSDAE
jgi:hypothetical protein